jgi:hypothetical protein
VLVLVPDEVAERLPQPLAMATTSATSDIQERVLIRHLILRLWRGVPCGGGAHHIDSAHDSCGVATERVVVVAVMLCSRHCFHACTPRTSRKGCSFLGRCGPATASSPGIGKTTAAWSTCSVGLGSSRTRWDSSGPWL